MNTIFQYDEKLFIQLQNFVLKNSWLDKPLVFLAQYLIYALPLLMLVLWFWSVRSKKATFKSVLASIVAWLGFAKLIAVLVNRPRPDLSLLQGKELLFHRPDTSFPSDHATMLFAFALSMRLYGFKTLGNILFVVAVLVSVSRVLVGVHYPFDVVGGAFLGCAVAYFFWLIREYIDKYLTNPIVGFLKRFHL